MRLERLKTSVVHCGAVLNVLTAALVLITFGFSSPVSGGQNELLSFRALTELIEQASEDKAARQHVAVFMDTFMFTTIRYNERLLAAGRQALVCFPEGGGSYSLTLDDFKRMHEKLCRPYKEVSSAQATDVLFSALIIDFPCPE